MFRDEQGRELFDVPDGPLPDPDTPAPPRFFPIYDNLFLSHKDRSRVYGEVGSWTVLGDDLNRVFGAGSVLIDGFVHAGWRIERADDQATLVIILVRPLPLAHREAVLEEGSRLLAFLASDARSHDIRFETADAGRSL